MKNKGRVEYVDDPVTGKKVPTCHRSSFDSLMNDPDFEMVMENSEADARKLYREEAKQIEEIRKGISDSVLDAIVDAFSKREDVDYLCRLVDYDEVKGQNYNLSVSTYVDQEDTREKISASA